MVARRIRRPSHEEQDRPRRALRHGGYHRDSQKYFPAEIWPERQEIGTDRVLFSVDYPFESMEEGATWFDAAEIGENDRDNIGRRNAARLFNLPNNL